SQRPSLKRQTLTPFEYNDTAYIFVIWSSFSCARNTSAGAPSPLKATFASTETLRALKPFIKPTLTPVPSRTCPSSTGASAGTMFVTPSSSLVHGSATCTPISRAGSSEEKSIGFGVVDFVVAQLERKTKTARIFKRRKTLIRYRLDKIMRRP